MSRIGGSRWVGDDWLLALGSWLLKIPQPTDSSQRAFLYHSPVQTGRHVLESAEFRRLVAGRWRVSLALTALLFVLYYGYIILIATNRQLVSRPVSGATTTGILIAAGVIAGAWVLTAAYVVWANRQYDPAVAQLRARAEKDHG